MQELEIKILEIDTQKVRDILSGIWAQKKLDSDILADFFINDRKDKIRLRRSESQNVMTFKTKIESTGIMHNEEFEVIFDDYEAMKNILIKTGFSHYGRSFKHREGYEYEGIIFDIDTYRWIPTYVEVESDSVEKVKKWVELLWYTMDQCVTLTESKLKEYYGIDANADMVSILK